MIYFFALLHDMHRKMKEACASLLAEILFYFCIRQLAALRCSVAESAVAGFLVYRNEVLAQACLQRFFFIFLYTALAALRCSAAESQWQGFPMHM